MTKGNTSNRGLASADKETRERVAREGGEASHGGHGKDKDEESTHEKKAEAGRKGGRH
jgi:general stress protein YciG